MRFPPISMQNPSLGMQVEVHESAWYQATAVRASAVEEGERP